MPTLIHFDTFHSVLLVGLVGVLSLAGALKFISPRFATIPLVVFILASGAVGFLSYHRWRWLRTVPNFNRYRLSIPESEGIGSVMITPWKGFPEGKLISIGVCRENPSDPLAQLSGEDVKAANFRFKGAPESLAANTKAETGTSVMLAERHLLVAPTIIEYDVTARTKPALMGSFLYTTLGKGEISGLMDMRIIAFVNAGLSCLWIGCGSAALIITARKRNDLPLRRAENMRRSLSE